MLVRQFLTIAVVAGLFLAICDSEFHSSLCAEDAVPSTNGGEFVRDIHELLANRCGKCHAGEHRKGGLRLESRDDLLTAGDSGEPAIIVGKPEASLLIERVASDDETERMPPSGDPLTMLEIETLKRWITDGAKWPAESKPVHWAYQAPLKPDLPAVTDTKWIRNPLDLFILKRLEMEGLTPSPETDRARLIRRVSLDLIGLPPSPEEVDAFVNDTREDAYEQLVDRLLASSHYGERWARPWLDLARYADSNGFQRDGFRDVWAYRDWVIHAFNQDMPFDQFTIEQMAGDLLSEATLSQKIATGFHRLPTVNVEAGVDQEVNRINAVVDRVNTTATTWLGTTLACAQCHNHKYDPFSQTEYYQLFSYFNNTAIETELRKGDTAAIDFVGPYLELPIPEKQKQERELLAARRELFDAKLAELTGVLSESSTNSSVDSETIDDLLTSEQQALTEGLDGLSEELPSKFAEWEAGIKTDHEAIAKLPKPIQTLLEIPAAERTAPQKLQLANHFLDQQESVKACKAMQHALQGQIDKLAPPETLVMVELEEPRTTHVLLRGDVHQPGDAVASGVPRSLHPLPDNAVPNRLALARWLVDPANPLVGRVTVNRWWSEFFGQGIVETVEDFGTRGARPTHPELLDWLAVEFVESGWSMKHIHRLIVMSATYRQESRFTPELLERDPENKLYARGPRFRLDAETIRDNALAISGLLSRKTGGPSVRPPQPDGLWKVIGKVDNTYRTSQGEDSYRRGIYTIWRRSSPYPSFVNFDAPDRASCVVQRSRTNTPLQALTLLNDPVFVDFAAGLARRALIEQPEGDLSTRMTHTFRVCLARFPTDTELNQLCQIQRDELQRFENDPARAKTVLGHQPIPERVSLPEFAAWLSIAEILLNLDETITKG